MTFSEFAQMLHPFFGGGQNQDEFVRNLVDKIIREPETEKEKQLAGNDEFNPIAKLQPDTLEKHFSGRNSLSKRNATSILGLIDKAIFEAYIMDAPHNALEGLVDKLRSLGHESTVDSVGAVCADIFEAILHERAGATGLIKKEDKKVSLPASAGVGHLLPGDIARLWSESEGTCQHPQCRAPLGRIKRGRSINLSNIFFLPAISGTPTADDAVLLCPDHMALYADATVQDLLELRASKKHIKAMALAKGEMSDVLQIETKLKYVLESIAGGNMPAWNEAPPPEYNPKRVQEKIQNQYLQREVLQRSSMFYFMVEEILADIGLAQKSFDSQQLAGQFTMLSSAALTHGLSQVDAHAEIVEAMVNKMGSDYRFPCQVIVAYYIQSCEVFTSNAVSQ